MKTWTHRRRLSYCITCKGRRHHLERTLRANLDAEARHEDVEFVLLDYDSDDGLGAWVREDFAHELRVGTLIYARHAPAPFFHMAHAKNMAHRIARGAILCNLDADNQLAPSFSRWLAEQFAAEPSLILSPRSLSVVGHIRQNCIDRAFHRISPTGGLCGRIATTSTIFHRLRGYNEAYSAWGGDDLELLLRARDNGVRVGTIPSRWWGNVLNHSDEDRISRLSPDDRRWSTARLQETAPRRLRRNVAQIAAYGAYPVHGSSDFGSGTITIDGQTRILAAPPPRDAERPVRRVVSA